MADQKLTQLTALASLSADDLFYVVDDPAGAALSRKMAASVLDSRYLQSANNLSDLANAATARINLSLVIGTNVQAWDADLDTIAGLAKADGNFIVGDGAAWVVESGATARASLGLGGLATLSSMTLADVAGYSTTTAHQTFALDAGTQVIFEQADGDDILTLYEASRGVQAHAHAAIGAQAAINGGSLSFGFSQVVMDIEESLTGIIDYHAGGAIYLEIDPTNDFAFSIANDVYITTKSGNTHTGVSMYGLQFAVEHGGDGDAGFFYGLLGSVFLRGGGDITHATGANVGVTVTGTGEMIDGVGLEISTPFIVNGSIRNLQGLVVFDQVGATSTNKAIETNAGHVVFNEGSDNDTDFRIEGATDSNLLMVDGSADTVQIGAATASDGAKFYVNGKLSTSGEVEINGALNHDGTELGVFATAPTTQKTVVGSRGGNAALASLLTQLASYGLVIDSTTA